MDESRNFVFDSVGSVMKVDLPGIGSLAPRTPVIEYWDCFFRSKKLCTLLHLQLNLCTSS